MKPIEVLAPVASAPFQLALATVTLYPLCVQVPLQPLATCWSPGKAKARAQLMLSWIPASAGMTA